MKHWVFTQVIWLMVVSLMVMTSLPSMAETLCTGTSPSPREDGGSSLESQLEELRHLREGIATLNGREEQRQRLLTLRTRFTGLASQLPERTGNAVRDLAQELEKLDFALIQDGEAGEIQRRLANTGTLLDILALQVSSRGETPCRHGTLVSKPCGFCGGKGKDPWGTSCKICGADGWVSVAADAPKCGGCEGKGTDAWGNVCKGCQGTGWVNVGSGTGNHENHPGAGHHHGNFGNQVVSKPCGFCGGKGKDSWGTPCKICGADGWVSIASDTPKCGNCQGAGQDPWRNVCPGCKGTGWAIADTDDHQGYYAFKPCAFCGGQGKDPWRNLCKVCGADGWVQVPSTAPQCGGCKGRGKDAWGRVCPGCKGTGWANVPTNPGYPPSPSGNPSQPDHPTHPGHHGGPEHHHDNWSLQICGSCKGMGKDSWGTLCKPCGGDGYVAIANTAVACGNCKGAGKDKWGDPCPGCQGTGWANTGPNPAWGGLDTSAPCGFCKGAGKDSWGSICPHCGGDGYVTTPSDQKKCGSCKGSGKDKWGSPCPGCQGTGWARSMESPASRP